MQTSTFQLREAEPAGKVGGGGIWGQHSLSRFQFNIEKFLVVFH